MKVFWHIHFLLKKGRDALRGTLKVRTILAITVSVPDCKVKRKPPNAHQIFFWFWFSLSSVLALNGLIWFKLVLTYHSRNQPSWAWTKCVERTNFKELAPKNLRKEENQTRELWFVIHHNPCNLTHTAREPPPTKNSCITLKFNLWLEINFQLGDSLTSFSQLIYNFKAFVFYEPINFYFDTFWIFDRFYCFFTCFSVSPIDFNRIKKINIK